MSRINKNDLKKILASRILLFFLGLALIALGIRAVQETYRKYQLAKEINSLRAEIARLENSSQSLNQLLEYLQDSSYLEKEARLKLNLRKPGEKMVVLPKVLPPLADQLGPQALAPAEKTPFSAKPEADSSPAHYWQWWEYFFGRD